MAPEVPNDHIKRGLTHYRGFVFRWQPYRQLSVDWDHDHCKGCWARFAERPHEWNDAVQTAGWVTLWPVGSDAESAYISEARAAGHVCIPSPKMGGFQLDWICAECFEGCCQELDFVVDSEHPQWKQAGL